MFEGLFHLGAMAVLVGAVFLNLDKVGAVASELSTRLDDLRPLVRGGLKALERPHNKVIDSGEEVLDPVYDTFAGFFLLWFADYDTALYSGWKKFIHFFHKRIRAPFMRGFRRGWHRIPVSILTIFSIVAFLYCVYATMRKGEPELPWLTIDQATEFYFWLFTVTIIWTFITALISHRLYTLGRVCTKFMNQIQKRNSASKAGQAEKAVSEAHDEVVGQNAVPLAPVDDESKE